MVGRAGPADTDGTGSVLPDGLPATMEYRPGFGRALAVGVAVLGVAAIIAGLISGAATFAPFVAPILLAMLLAWACYWRPAVIVTPAGVEVRNVTRTVDLPWPAIQRIDTKYALTLQTAYGSYSAWAAPAPGRAGAADVSRDKGSLPSSTYTGATIGLGDLPDSPSGSAAALIRRRWEELRDSGALDNPRLEFARPRVRWHWVTLAGIVALLAASLLPVLL